MEKRETSTSDSTAHDAQALAYEVAQDRVQPDAWRVEHIDYERDGAVEATIFLGPQAQERAEEYATFKNRPSSTRTEQGVDDVTSLVNKAEFFADLYREKLDVLNMYRAAAARRSDSATPDAPGLLRLYAAQIVDAGIRSRTASLEKRKPMNRYFRNACASNALSLACALLDGLNFEEAVRRGVPDYTENERNRSAAEESVLAPGGGVPADPDHLAAFRATEKRMRALAPFPQRSGDGAFRVLIDYATVMTAFFGEKDDPNRWPESLASVSPQTEETPSDA